jgi:hypothetical protein
VTDISKVLTASIIKVMKLLTLLMELVSHIP